MASIRVNGVKAGCIAVKNTEYIVVDRVNDILTGPDENKVTASSTSQDGAIWKAFDGVTTGTEQNCWIPEYGSTNCWICYHFSSPKMIQKCKVYFYQNMNGTYTGSIKFQGSTDGTTWVDITSSFALSMTSGIHAYEILSIDKSHLYSYVRMYSENALVVYGHPSACTLEVEIYGTDHTGGGSSPMHFKTWAKFDGYGINLPHKLNGDYQITVDFYESTYNLDASIIGNSDGPYCSHLTSYNDKYYASSGTSEINFGSWSAGEHTFITNYNGSKNMFDGVEVSGYSPHGDNTCVYSLGCRGGEGSHGYSGYLKKYTIESISTGDKICELLPCLYDNVTPCLYDTVNKKFYYPEGLTVMDEIPTT